MLSYALSLSGFDHITRSATHLCNHLAQVFQDKEIDTDLRNKNLNIVKMTLYLFTQIMKVKDVKLAADVCSFFFLNLFN